MDPDSGHTDTRANFRLPYPLFHTIRKHLMLSPVAILDEGKSKNQQFSIKSTSKRIKMKWKWKKMFQDGDNNKSCKCGTEKLRTFSCVNMFEIFDLVQICWLWTWTHFPLPAHFRFDSAYSVSLIWFFDLWLLHLFSANCPSLFSPFFIFAYASRMGLFCLNCSY